MERKSIDICLGDLPTALSLSQLSKIERQYRLNEDEDLKEYFGNNPLFTGETFNKPNIIHVNFKDTISDLRSGFSYKNKMEVSLP